MADPFDLNRFVEAQARDFGSAVSELRAGRKRSHWMWYLFPQIEGLGETAMSKRYAIVSLDEARAYRAHPVLGPRLTECTQLVLDVEGRTARQIFSSPDDLKFRSCMTLFDVAASGSGPFRAALRKYYDGQPDKLTLQLLDIR